SRSTSSTPPRTAGRSSSTRARSSASGCEKGTNHRGTEKTKDKEGVGLDPRLPCPFMASGRLLSVLYAPVVQFRCAMTGLVPRVTGWVEAGAGRSAFGRGISEILQAVDGAGSIKGAAGERGKSYRHVWARVKEAEAALGRPLVEAHVGGRGPRRSFL